MDDLFTNLYNFWDMSQLSSHLYICLPSFFSTVKARACLSFLCFFFKNKFKSRSYICFIPPFFCFCFSRQFLFLPFLVSQCLQLSSQLVDNVFIRITEPSLLPLGTHAFHNFLPLLLCVFARLLPPPSSSVSSILASLFIKIYYLFIFCRTTTPFLHPRFKP